MMQCLKLVKKLSSNISPAEERAMAGVLNDSPATINIILGYMEQEIVSIDKKLSNTSKLYSQSGAPHLAVAALLATREKHMKLRNLLIEKDDILDADHAGD